MSNEQNDTQNEGEVDDQSTTSQNVYQGLATEKERKETDLGTKREALGSLFRGKLSDEEVESKYAELRDILFVGPQKLIGYVFAKEGVKDGQEDFEELRMRFARQRGVKLILLPERVQHTSDPEKEYIQKKLSSDFAPNKNLGKMLEEMEAGREGHMAPATIYAYKEGELQKLLDENAEVLTRVNWPLKAEEFVRTVDVDQAHYDGDLLKLIQRAFNGGWLNSKPKAES